MSRDQITAASAYERRVTVWDPLVRFAHWALVIAFAAAYLSAEEETGGPDAVHVWSGYIIGGLVILRVIWGLIGPQRARFVDFLYSPAQDARYLVDMAFGRARRYLGHSPAGGAMVIALLVCLLGTVGTGLIAYGEQGKGPLAVAVTTSVVSAQAEENADHEMGSPQGRTEGRHSAIGDIHGTLANVTLALVVLHILGVGFACIVHRENLVASMIHGTKRAGD